MHTHIYIYVDRQTDRQRELSNKKYTVKLMVNIIALK